MALRVIRSFGCSTRYRYKLLQNNMFMRKLLSDNEYRFAVVSPDLTMVLRSDASDISKAELEDPTTQIITIEVQ